MSILPGEPTLPLTTSYANVFNDTEYGRSTHLDTFSKYLRYIKHNLKMITVLLNHIYQLMVNHQT